SHWHPSDQHLFDEFSENTLTNFYLPYSIAPNFLVNNEVLHIPMVVEESSVVASASAAAKFWLRHGGFHAVVRSTLKTGHVHFTFSGNKNLLFEHWSELKPKLFKDFASITVHMENRGGGVVDILLEDCTSLLVNYFRLSATFETVDAMGAN